MKRRATLAAVFALGAGFHTAALAEAVSIEAGTGSEDIVVVLDNADSKRVLDAVAAHFGIEVEGTMSPGTVRHSGRWQGTPSEIIAWALRVESYVMVGELNEKGAQKRVVLLTDGRGSAPVTAHADVGTEPREATPPLPVVPGADAKKPSRNLAKPTGYVPGISRPVPAAGPKATTPAALTRRAATDAAALTKGLGAICLGDKCPSATR